MRTILKVLRDIIGIPELRNRVLITIGLLGVYRIGFHIFLPGVNIRVLEDVLANQQGSGLMDFIGLTSSLTGGNLRNATVFSLGIMPYISASIIFSLLVKVFPRLEAMQKEGESGRRQINRYTRYFTVVLCLIQAVFVLQFLHGSTGLNREPISAAGWDVKGMQILILTTGTLFLMWLGEKITEFGIGNGVSLIIMAGIIADLPGAVVTMLKAVMDAPAEEKPYHVLQFLFLFLLFIMIVAAVVYITKGQRRIPVQQARTVKGRRVYGGQRHYMPIKVNSAGVLPIIFAQSLILLPTGLIGYMFPNATFLDFLQMGTFFYYSLYVLMIGFFTYFWTSLMFNPVEISDNMKEYGSFIPGIRPGRRTAEYLQQVLGRITLAGAAFLAIIALIPQIVTNSMGVQMMVSGMLGGTGMLIIVGVALDLVDKIEAQLLVRHYEGFMRPGEESKS